MSKSNKKFVKKAFITPAIIAVILTIITVFGLIAASNWLPFNSNEIVVAEDTNAQLENINTTGMMFI